MEQLSDDFKEFEVILLGGKMVLWVFFKYLFEIYIEIFTGKMIYDVWPML